MFAALGLVVIGAALLVPLRSGGVVEVADRFDPQAPVEVRSSVEPYRLVCLGGNPCPSVSRSWEFDRVVSSAELSTWLDDAGFTGELRGDCDDPPGPTVPACSFRGEASGYSTQLFLRVDAGASTSSLTLNVR